MSEREKQLEEVARELLARLSDAHDDDIDCFGCKSGNCLDVAAIKRATAMLGDPPAKCARCSGTGSIPNGTDEMACGDCTGTGEPASAGESTGEGGA